MGIYETFIVSFIERVTFYMALALMTPEERLWYLMAASMMSNLVRELTKGFSKQTRIGFFTSCRS